MSFFPKKPVFPRKKFVGSKGANNIGAKYRAAMDRQPFLLFGLPFLTVMVVGSFVLTPATAVRYERYDRKVRQLTREEELGIHRNAHKPSLQEEYFKLSGGKDYNNWEQKRAPRLPGEVDGILE
ncbi:cytochrome c oxidase assembly protein COX16-domain-containing protein [Xylariaceae sp. FL0804]|nr:cytochrome c oxidase assembly protein COX16-domain-containing protein [Xylariaceae sp. FL0804]